MVINKNNLPPLLALLFVSLAVCLPLLKPGLPATDDGISMVLRATGFHESFQDGHVPVRWIQRLNENYGYPVMNFLYPLPFYVAQIPNMLGFSAIASIKLTTFLSVLLGAIGFFQLSKQTLSKTLSTLVSIAFLASPYLHIDLYQRGSLGEIVAFGVVPWLLLSIQKAIAQKKLRQVFVSGILWALLATSHNTLALILSPLVLFYSLSKVSKGNKTQKQITRVLLTVLIGLAVSAFFWAPAILELGETRSSSIQISQVSSHFQTINQTVLNIGLAGLFILILAIFFTRSRTVAILVAFTLFALGLQFPASEPVWQLLLLDKLVQFPIRFMSILTVATPLLLIEAWNQTKSKTSIQKFTGVLILVSLAISIGGVTKVENSPLTTNFFDTNFDSTTNQKEFSPKSVKQDPETMATSAFQISSDKNNFSVLEEHVKTQEKHLQINISESVQVSFNTSYFPGWTLYIDGVETDFQTDELGRITPQIIHDDAHSKTHDLVLIWQETALRKTANYVSALTIILSVAAIVFSYASTKSQAVGILCLSWLFIWLSLQLYWHKADFAKQYDPIQAKKSYEASQWVDPESKHPIGDHGLYAWAGWAYTEGENPILINSEMPPLGKYLIGVSLRLTTSVAVTGTIFSFTFLISLYLLSLQMIKDKYLSLVPLALISIERIFYSTLTVTMLDSLLLTFLCLGFYSILKTQDNKKWFIAASIFFGAVASTKFYVTGLLVILSVTTFFAVTKKWKLLLYFSLSSSLSLFVHALSYFRYFILGGSLRGYLGVQKFIWTFYSTGTTDVPTGSYWQLVFLNKWRVWWGPSWGEFYTLTTKEWRLTWPIAGALVLILVTKLLIKIWRLWFKKGQPIHLEWIILFWLLTYSAFLSLIGGWPHYMLLFLPFSSILLVRNIKRLLTKNKKINTQIKRIIKTL